MALICSYPLSIETEGKPLFLILLDHLLKLRPAERATITRSTRKQVVDAYPSFRIQRYVSGSRIVS
jgi:hypothetical protein